MFKIGDIVCPNGAFASSADVRISNIRKAKVTEIFREHHGGNHGMEIEILEGNGTANEYYQNSTLMVNYHRGYGNNRNGNFRNPSNFGPGDKVRLFQRPFKVMQSFAAAELRRCTGSLICQGIFGSHKAHSSSG